MIGLSHFNGRHRLVYLKEEVCVFIQCRKKKNYYKMNHSYNASTISDQEKAHKALLELEIKFNKKPRTGALGIQGSQIQALTGFNRIFEQYPYPVVINAAILKLADWFRTQ
jgi:hypothetical protein